MMKKNILLFLISAVTAFSTIAQEKLTFKYNPKIGEKLNYQSTINMDIEGPQSVIMDMNIKMFQTAQAKDNNGVFDVSAQLEAIKVEMNMGAMMASYDSENPDESNPISQQLGQQFGKIIGKDIKIKIDETAEVKEITGIEEMQGMGDMKSMFSAATFPKDPIAEGESWDMSVENEQLGATLTYKLTYVGKEDGLIRVNVESSPQDENAEQKFDSKGFNLYDPKTFVLEKSEMDSNISVQGANIKSKVSLQKL